MNIKKVIKIVKSKKNKRKYQSLDEQVSQEQDLEHKGDMGIHIGDACLRYSTDHKMMIPTSYSHNVLNPNFPICKYNLKCDYETERDKDNIKYCNYFMEKK